ncbi:MAG TPA: YpdA family putative bacillithiol disulfide reductase [Candidatus Acidoferrum sp.]|jgi:thioredoxin reductase (NADPH)
MENYDLICVGAGPTGLASAIEAKRAGMRPLVIDKGCLCNSIYHYPANMIFFTTPELLEIGDLPLTTQAEKPTRIEALKYYRKCAEHYELDVRLYETVLRVEGGDGNFTVVTQPKNGKENKYGGEKIVVATGYYDLPNELGVKGENLPHVSHYYTEPFAYWREPVVVVGGKSSAAEAALELYRNGAHVTLVHRDAELGASIKYWLRPDILNRIKAGQVKALFESRVKEITENDVLVSNKSGETRLPAKRVFLLTGHHPDYDFIESLGIKLDPDSRRPALDPNSLESNVPGIHLAGVIIGGRFTGEIFIENGRFHGKQIVEALIRSRENAVAKGHR